MVTGISDYKKLIERQIIKNSLSESKATELITVLNLIK